MEHGFPEGDVEAAVLERQLLAGRDREGDLDLRIPSCGALAGDLDASLREVERRHLGAAPRQ